MYKSKSKKTKVLSTNYRGNSKISILLSLLAFIALVYFSYRMILPKFMQKSDINLVSTAPSTSIAIATPAPYPSSTTSTPCVPGKVDSITTYAPSCGTLGFGKYTYTCKTGSQGTIATGMCVEIGDAIIQMQKFCASNCASSTVSAIPASSSAVVKAVTASPNPTLYTKCVSACLPLKSVPSRYESCMAGCR